MHYQDVLICEANELDRQVFSRTLVGCYISQCDGIKELNELLNESDFDVIFLGRSAVIQILDKGALALDKLSEVESCPSLYMFQVSEDHKIQVKKISLHYSDFAEECNEDYYNNRSSTGSPKKYNIL